MGLFSGIKSTLKKSEAAVLVQRLLEHQADFGSFTLDPARLATELVQRVWELEPDIYNGKFGQRPHKITVATTALANGIDLFDNDDLNKNALALSLGSLFSELETNGRLYPLNSLDHQLLETSAEVFMKFSQEFSESSAGKEADAILSHIDNQEWEDWLKVFKAEAAKANPQLEINKEGGSLIDFMDHEILKKAQKDNVDPKYLAVNFAKQFDITKFGK